MKMKILNKPEIHLLITFFALILIQGCDYGELKQKAVTGESTIVSDETLAPLMREFKSEFERLNPEAKLNYTVQPSKVAITELLNRDVKSILVGRELNEEELQFAKKVNLELKKYEVALDGIGFIVSPESPIERLTSEDLKKIFSGQVTKWSQIKVEDEEQNQNVLKKLKGAKDDIKLYIQRPNSSLYDLVKDSALKINAFAESSVICSTSVQILESVRKNMSGIGVINLSWISIGNQDEQDSTIRPVRISFITPSGTQRDYAIFHQGTVAYRSYPYIRKIYFYTSEVDINVITGFVSFLLNKDGQTIVLKNGLVPVSQPLRIIKLD